MISWSEEDNGARAFTQYLHIGCGILFCIQPNISSTDNHIGISWQYVVFAMRIRISIDTFTSISNPFHPINIYSEGKSQRGEAQVYWP